MGERVCHFIFLDEAPDSPPFGGAENHLLILLPALVLCQLDVELVALVNRVGPLLQQAIEKLKSQGVRVLVIETRYPKTPKWIGLRTIYMLFHLYYAFFERKNYIVHLHLDFVYLPIMAWVAGCKKVVVTIHNDEEWFAMPWNRMWLHFVDCFVSSYIAISERIKEYYQEQAVVAPSKITRIYYGLEVQPESSRRKTRSAYQIPELAFVVGFVGRLTYQKNVELLIGAAKFLADIHFVIVGDGPLREVLHLQASTLQNIQFLGYQPHGSRLIECFDLFCLPSRFEGLGLVLVEAMQLGVPVIASRAGAIPEVLNNGQAGLLFSSGNLEELKEKIKYARNHMSELLELAKLARSFAIENYNITKMANQTSEVYRKFT